MKLTNDRRWYLRQFEDIGWTFGRAGMVGLKKWDRHRDALIKAGLLEVDEYKMMRITGAGREALREGGQ